MPQPLTWPAILALDDAALNIAIDQLIYGYTWCPVQYGDSEPGDWWQCTDEPDVLVTRSSVPYHHHTATWERTMALAWAYQIALWPLLPGAQGWLIQHPASCTALGAQTAPEARVALCQLALWQAVQAQRVGLVPPEDLDA